MNAHDSPRARRVRIHVAPVTAAERRSEILRDDTRNVAERARGAGVEAVHQEWDGLVHAFPVFADSMPEGKAAFRRIADFVRGRGPAGQ